MGHFYRCFLPRIASKLSPFTDVLKGGGRGATPISWTWRRRSKRPKIDGVHQKTWRTRTLRPTSASWWMPRRHMWARSYNNGIPIGQRESARILFQKRGPSTDQILCPFDRESTLLFGESDVSTTCCWRASASPSSRTIKPLPFALSCIAEPWTVRQQSHFAFTAEYSSPSGT
jgi:hypothetical protein